MEAAKKTPPSFKDILIYGGIFIWNVVLYFFAFGFSVLLGAPGSFAAPLIYFFVGVLSRLWTPRIIMTIIPSAIAFPVALASFRSAIIGDDTQGQTRLSLFSSIKLMEQHEILAYAAAIMAAVIGWSLIQYALQSRNKSVQEKRTPTRPVRARSHKH